MASSLFAKLQEELREKMVAEGWAEGRAEGRAEGFRRAAEIVLAQRLGSVPASLRAALDTSDPAALERAFRAIAATDDSARLEASVLAALSDAHGA